jgi:nicotinic acid mononucleotide adenylyltransferase
LSADLSVGERFQLWTTRGSEVTLLRATPGRLPAFVRVPRAATFDDTATADELLLRFREQYVAAEANNQRMLERWRDRWLRDADRLSISLTPDVERVGYILGTFSPVHRGHLALIHQAVADLRLDRVFAIVWPFRQIKGFHPPGLRRWARDQQHLRWADRAELLRLALAGGPASLLEESRAWYLESRANFSSRDPLSPYWTGMWYVLRKLRWQLDQRAGRPLMHVNLLGADQLNRHVAVLLRRDTGTHRWTDYSIAQQLASHHIYGVPRGDRSGPIEAFTAPDFCPHNVFIGAQPATYPLAASDVRFGLLGGMSLEEALPSAVARQVRTQGWWGYDADVAA